MKMPFGINEVRRAIDRVELKVAIGSHGCPPKAIAAVLAVPRNKKNNSGESLEDIG
jgi:predicted ABC-type ATPase